MLGDVFPPNLYGCLSRSFFLFHVIQFRCFSRDVFLRFKLVVVAGIWLLEFEDEKDVINILKKIVRKILY